MQAKSKRKRPSTIKKAVAIDRIDKMVPLIIDNVSIAMRLESTLETGNETIAVIRGGAERGPQWYGAHCYSTVSYSVTLTLALTLARLFDAGSRNRHANRRGVASIPLLLRLLKQKRCRSVLVCRARDWTPAIPSMATHHEATVNQAIDAAIAAYAKLMSNPSGRAVAARLKEFRDKKLAHSLIDAVLNSLPKFEDLFLLLKVAMEVTAHARLAVAGIHWEPDDFREEGQRQGRAFWNPAIKAVIEAEQR